MGTEAVPQPFLSRFAAVPGRFLTSQQCSALLVLCFVCACLPALSLTVSCGRNIRFPFQILPPTRRELAIGLIGLTCVRFRLPPLCVCFLSLLCCVFCLCRWREGEPDADDRGAGGLPQLGAGLRQRGAKKYSVLSSVLLVAITTVSCVCCRCCFSSFFVVLIHVCVLGEGGARVCAC